MIDKNYYLQKGLVYFEEKNSLNNTSKTLKINEVKFDDLLSSIIKKMIFDNRINLAKILLKSYLNIKHLGTCFYNYDDALIIEEKNSGFFIENKKNAYLIEVEIPYEYLFYISNEYEKIFRKYFNEIIEKLDSQYLGLFQNAYYEIKFVTHLPKNEENWRHLLEKSIVDTKKFINNQCNIIQNLNIIEYNNLKYKSPAEVEITKELSKRDILYFPLPVAVINNIKKEPDFLIQHPDTKKFGILEINGDTYHTPLSSQEDHKRSSVFFEKGILVQFVSAKECFENSSKVVDNFLKKLEKF